MSYKTETIGRTKWQFEVSCGAAMITRVSANVSGDVIIPSMLGGVKVICARLGSFEGCTKLQSVTIPDSLTAAVNSIEDAANYGIDSHLFKDCTSLRTIKVSKRNPAYKSANGLLLSKGGETVVAAPRGLMNVKIPAGVNKIGEAAFKGCSRLKSVTLPDGVMVIEMEAFEGCISLENVVIPRSVRSIKEAAFKGCSKLTSVKIPASLRELPYPMFDGNNGAFADCRNLREILVEKSNRVFKSIDGLLLEKDAKINGDVWGMRREGYALRAVPGGLTSVTVPDCVTSISFEAFEGCRKLKSLTIPSSIMNIAGYVFGDCVGLESVTIPNRLRDDVVPNKLFHDKRIPDDLFPKGTKITRIISADDKIDPKEAAEIAKRKIIGNKKIMGENVNGIVWAFRFTDDFKGAMIMKVPKSISGDVVVPQSLGGAKVTAIWGGAFENCRKLKNVTIPDSVESCWANFSGCNRLESVTISAGMTDFDPHPGISYVLGGRVASFNMNMFKTSNSLCAIKVPEQNPMYKSSHGLLLSKDGKKVLAVPAGMTSMTIPDGVEEFGWDAIKECNRLKSVKIVSESVDISAGMFKGCSRLREFVVPEQNSRYEFVDGLLLKKNKNRKGKVLLWAIPTLTKVVIPDGVTCVAGWAFNCCMRLKRVTFPLSVTRIMMDAFCDCERLTSLTFPDAMSCVIESDAFRRCWGLERVTLPAGVRKEKNAFPCQVAVKRVKHVK